MFQVYPYNAGNYLSVREAHHHGVRISHPIFISLYFNSCGHFGIYASLRPNNDCSLSIINTKYKFKIDSYQELIDRNSELIHLLNKISNSSIPVESRFTPKIFDDAPRQKIYLPGALAVAELTRWPITGPHCEPMNAPDCQYCSNRKNCRYAFKPGERAS